MKLVKYIPFALMIGLFILLAYPTIDAWKMKVWIMIPINILLAALFLFFGYIFYKVLKELESNFKIK